MKYSILSFVFLLIIGSTPISAQELPTTIYGIINNDTPFAEIPLTVEGDGNTIILDMHKTGGDLDTLLYLVDEYGNIIAQNDDRDDVNLGSYIELHQTLAGQYTVIATRYGVAKGSTSGEFELLVNIEEAATEAEAFDISDEDLLAAGFPAIESHEQAEWTILAYYGADTNLEADLLNDFNEFELAGGSNEKVRILILLDRHPDFADQSGNWFSTRLFEINADTSDDHDVNYPPTIDTLQITDLGNLDTGNGEVFAQFLAWGIKNYPAKHYGIAFAGHGAGWQGIVTDDTGDLTILDNLELRRAFATATQIAGVEKFDLLINDACLMSSIEYYAAISDYFHYSLASPEIVYTPALDMTLFATTINDNPDADLEKLGKDLVTTYIEYDIAQRPGTAKNFLTHAITNLDEYDGVVIATEHFAEVINSDPELFSDLIGLARANTYTYTSFIGGDTMIDLGHFMRQVIILTSDFEVVEAARDVILALEEARVYSEAGDYAAGRILYYNIYFPISSKDFSLRYFKESRLTGWGRMLRNYYNITTPRLWSMENSVLTYHPAIPPKVAVTRVYPQVSSVTFPPTVNIEIVGRSISYGSFTVDQIQADGSALRLLDTNILTSVVLGDEVDYINSWNSGVDLSLFSWLPLNLPVVSDTITSNNEFLIRVNDMAALEGRYREPDTEEWHDATILFTLDGEIQSIISRSNVNSAMANINIAPNSEFQAYRYIVRSDGQIKPEPGNIYLWGEDGVLSWSDDPTPSGDYNLGFLVSAFGGTTGFDSVTVTVDNDEFNPDLRGYTDVTLGINFQHPADWSAVDEFGDQLTSVNPDGTAHINVYHFPARDDIFAIVNRSQELFGFEVSNEKATATIAEQSALEFSFSYEDDNGGIWSGMAFAIYRETAQGEVGIIFSVEAVDISPESLENLYQPLRDNFTLFDSAALDDSDPSLWQYNFINRTVAYPILSEWDLNSVEDGMWTFYLPTGDGSFSSTFLAVAQLEGEDPEVALSELLTNYGIYDNFEIHPYHGEFHSWQTGHYTKEIFGEPIVGRFYVTQYRGELYAIRFETINDEAAPELFRGTFEPIVDGFAPRSRTAYASGDVKSSFIKASIVIADSICANATRNELCIGGGTVTVATSSGITPDNFGEPGDTINLADVQMVEIGTDDGGIDPFSVAMMTIQSNLSEDDSGKNVQLTAFGGTSIINNSALDPGEVAQLDVFNNSEYVVNIRQEPNTESPVVDSMLPWQTTIAVARLENSDNFYPTGCSDTSCEQDNDGEGDTTIDLRLEYDHDSFTLISISERPLWIVGLSFESSSGELSIDQWDSEYLSASLELFPPGDCLQAWDVFEETELPQGCGIRHGWISVGEPKMFWRNTDVFTVYRYGEAIVECAIESGYCDVNLESRLVQESPADIDLDGVPDDLDNCPNTSNYDQQDIDNNMIGDACDFVAPSVGTNLRLEYDYDSFTLINVFERPLWIAGLSFESSSGELSINEWNNDNLSAPLEAFPSGDCLQVWYLFEEAQPPGNCVIRHGWVSVNEQKLFWRNTDVFTVYRYGEEVTVCTIEAGYCDVNLGAQAAPVPEAPENDYWVRVQLPNNPGETGWISGTLLGSAYDMSSLHIADPTRPHFAPMQSMSILLNQNSTTAQSSALDGVLIQTPSGEKSIILEINGASFEIAANSKFFWRGATNELAELETETENSYDLINRRRPEGWSATVLRGAVRVNINYLDEKNQEDQTYTVTLVAGTEIEYNSTSAEAEDITTETATHTPEDSALSPSIPVIVTTSNDSAEINAAMASTPGEEDSADALSDAEMDEFWNNQALFNAVNMDYAVIMGDYFIDDPMGNNYHESGDDEQLIDFMFDETDIDIYGLATLVEGNEDLYYLFIEDEEYVEYFGDEYGYNPFEDPNYDPFCDTNPNDPYCQETFVDCSLYPEDPICVNDGDGDDLDCPCDVDFECSPGCNCDPECGEYDNYGYCGCDIDNECSPGCECDFECSSDPYYGGEPVG